MGSLQSMPRVILRDPSPYKDHDEGTTKDKWIMNPLLNFGWIICVEVVIHRDPRVMT